MANEIYPYLRRTLRGKVEATYGASTTINDADLVFALEAEVTYAPEVISRNGVSALRPGFRPYTGSLRGSYSVTTEVDASAIDGGTPTYPHCDPWISSSGFLKAVGNDAGLTDSRVGLSITSADSITYTINSNSSQALSSVKLQFDQVNADASKGIRTVLTGCRSSMTLDLVAGESVKLTLEGSGIATQPTDVATPSIDETYPAASVRPFVASGMAWSLTALEDSHAVISADIEYGGGSAAARVNQIRSLSIDTAQAVTEDVGLAASGAVARVRHSPTEPFTLSLVIECVDLDEWDSWDYITDNMTLHLTTLVSDSISSANSFYIDCYFTPTEITKSDGDGLCVLEITGQGIYPNDGTDGGGLKPASPLTLKFIKNND